MSNGKKRAARAVADVTEGTIFATVDIAAAPERVFRALTSDEVTQWWGAAEVYRTTAWAADLRVGGQWRADGVGADGNPFWVEGEYLEIDAPRKLVTTWKPKWDGGATTRVTYRLAPIAGGTRVTLRHEGFGERTAACDGHMEGWERVLGWLDRYMTPAPAAQVAQDAQAAQPAPAAPEARFFVCRLLPPRPSFMADMTPDELGVMQAHAAYWRGQLEAGNAIVFGPVADPRGGWGLGVIRAADEAAMKAFEAADPAIASGRGFSYEVLPMLRAVFKA